jgi:uncharacterized protein (DUF1697 family)
VSEVNTYIALFRGINIGGHHLLPMKNLEGLFKGMGFQQVKTYIQSGNVVFKSTLIDKNNIAKEISSRILKYHGFAPAVLLLEISELQDAINNNPFKTTDGKALHFFFLESYSKHPDLEGMKAIKRESEQFRLHHKIFYLYAPEGVGHSKLALKVEKSLGVPVTGRNWNTVRELISLAGNEL